jgi:release factor glutamine methyltransferase
MLERYTQSLATAADQPEARATGPDLFRPSDYTGMLMHAVHMRTDSFGRGRGLDMGVGNGVLLATLGALGVAELWGVDIDPDALAVTRTLLRGEDLLDRSRLLQGSLWQPIGNARFDIVVANLPHFAATQPSDPDHSRYWSMGGPDGRALLDPFLADLGAHLNDAGVALITHNVFVGRRQTEAMLAEQGLSARVVLSTTVALPPAKIGLLQPEIRARYTGAGIRRFGPYEFADVEILEIRHG